MYRKIAIVIVAAGKSFRCSNNKFPKQYELLGGQPILLHVINNFLNNKYVGYIQVVINRHHKDFYDRYIVRSVVNSKILLPFVYGGDTRKDSVRLGLESISSINPDYVLIHDACRPFFSNNLVNKAIEMLANYVAVVPVISVVDTVKVVHDSMIVDDIDRNTIRAVQTPQAYRYLEILNCHRLVHNSNTKKEFTDDSSIVMECNIPVYTISGEYQNFKITTDYDLDRARCLNNLERSRICLS